nr:immunoglobulin light chain junction region [Macaca mulatta]MOX16927.1 immunoglobulin light chain junction region [Macaca mulatta]MOX17828.1 immunoglobulin light chain junction region [Macaca mulatta]MOX18135.1 immunoglobulin light chain junction region [Macaca mulatta]MOX18326.1 immunoglobulin light chain junction region [Macaca mulatta]
DYYCAIGHSSADYIF